MQSLVKDTIIAQATAPGRGSVGIVRVSGPNAKAVATAILKKCPQPRTAEYLKFYHQNDSVVDEGIALFFVAPHSFTGEDVIEFQGHGGQLVNQLLIDQCLATGLVRLAKPGEFSEQAFLNDKLDLAQAEAIADLINASSMQAAKSAVNSMQGVFSKNVNQIVEKVTHLRMYVEAAIDFPEEEIDFLQDSMITDNVDAIISDLEKIKNTAKQGALLRDGMKVVIVGRPNAGKSSLLNALSGRETAIVTDIAGTTRDVLKEHIHIDGMPLHIIDTAGLREGADVVEQIGIDRAWQEIEKADCILLMIDASQKHQNEEEFINKLTNNQAENTKLAIVRNKCDLSNETPGIYSDNNKTVINISAKKQLGIDFLCQYLKDAMGFEQTSEDQTTARKRHLIAIDNAYEHIKQGQYQLQHYNAGELLAEEFRIAQNYLSEITGEFTSDDLLGKIFSSFCIGK